MKRFFLLLLTVIILTAAQSQTAEEIIEKHIEAIGGADAWRKVNSIILEGSMQVQGAEISVTQYILHNKGNRQEFTIAGMKGFMIITPTEGWNFMPFQGQQSPEPMTTEDVAKSQSELDAQGILVDYSEKGHKVEYLGKDEVDGTECFKIRVIPKGQDPVTMFIDTQNYLLIRQISRLSRNGREMEQTTNFSNYEKLPEGILVPKSISMAFGELNISKIIINSDIEESIFQPK